MEQTQSIKDLIQEIDDKKIYLPEFQRDFVWEITKTYDLFDSLVKGNFIGAIIYGIPSFEIAVREIMGQANFFRLLNGMSEPQMAQMAPISQIKI